MLEASERLGEDAFLRREAVPTTLSLGKSAMREQDVRRCNRLGDVEAELEWAQG